MASGESHPNKQSLPVLPHSGKVDQLKREMQTERPMPDSTAPAPATAANPDPPAPVSDPARSIQQKLLEGKVIEVLRSVFDPEIPVNIYDLGLIYSIDVDAENNVKVKMTLTAPACPVAGSLPPQVESKIENIPEVKSASVELVWDPPWSRDRMSEAAMLDLGLF